MAAGGRTGLKGASSVPEGDCSFTFIIWRIGRTNHPWVKHLPNWILLNINTQCVASYVVTVISQRYSRLYLGHSSLQNNVPDRQRGCVKHGCHHHQYIRSACWTVSGKMQQNTDPIFVICRHRTHFALNTAHKGGEKSYHHIGLSLHATIWAFTHTPPLISPSVIQTEGMFKYVSFVLHMLWKLLSDHIMKCN